MKKTSKALIEIMMKEASEERPVIEDMIRQMEYTLNKKVALLENTIRCHLIVLQVSHFTSTLNRISLIVSGHDALVERSNILNMPASPLFKKGGFHHKFTVDEDSGEVVMKHPKKSSTVYPEPFKFHLF